MPFWGPWRGPPVSVVPATFLIGGGVNYVFNDIEFQGDGLRDLHLEISAAYSSIFRHMPLCYVLLCSA